MSFPSSSNKAPNIFIETFDYTGSPSAVKSSGSASSTSLVNVTSTPPVASFTFTPSTGFTPFTANFTDTSTGAITGWLWDFGDGSFSSVQSPSHVYTAGGLLTTTLTVTGQGGSTTASHQIKPPTLGPEEITTPEEYELLI